MTASNKTAPGTAATDPRASIVASGKRTRADSPKSVSVSSAIAGAGKVSRRPSLRTAVNAMCKGCIYDPGSGNGAWRQQVQACASSNCPLHSVRPVPVKARKTLHIAAPIGFGAVGAAELGSALPAAGMGLNGDTANERRAA